MAISVVNQWQATAGNTDHEIAITPADGNWLVCVIGWRTTDGVTPKFSVGDLRRNLWSTGRATVHPTAGIGVQVWVCPNVKTYGGSTKVYVAAIGVAVPDAGSVPVTVFEVAGVTGGLVFDLAGGGTTSPAGSIPITAPAPAAGANCLMIAAGAADSTTAASTSGTGWTGLTQVTDTAPNVGLMTAWREATTGGTCTFTLTSGTASWAGVSVLIQAAGALPAVTPDWGVVSVEAQLALGYDASTPVSAMRWKTLSTLCQRIQAQRGLTAELGTVDAQANTLDWINDNGSMTPRAGGSAVVVAAGTTTTAPIADVDAAGFVIGDFVRLQTYLGALKEDTVFQITAKLSSGGVTTVSFTPAAAAAPAVGDLLAGVPVDIFTPARVVATVDAKTYPVMCGTSEALPQTWLDGTHGRVSMTVVDAYATLTADVPNAIDGEILRGRPIAYWKLDDPSGAGQAANSSGRSSVVLTQAQSKFGAASATADFGASTQDVNFGPGPSSLIGAGSSSGWGQSGLASGDTTKGFALVGTSDDFPAISGGVTIVGVSCLFTAQPTGDGTIFVIRPRDPSGGGGAGAALKLALDPSTAYATITVWDKDTHVATRTVCSSGPCIIGNSGWISWAVSFTRTAWTLYTNGTTFTQSGSCDLVDVWSVIDIGGEADGAWNGHCTNGVHSRVAVYDRVLSAGEVGLIAKAMTAGMGAQTSIDGTIRRHLTNTGWPGARILARSDTITSEDIGLDRSAVGDVVAQAATWEDGLLWIDAAGYLQFRSRDLLDRQASKFTLGPNTGGGEIPYLGAPAYDADGKLLFTEIDVLNTAKIGRWYGGAAADRSGTVPAIAPAAATKGIRPRPWPTHLYDTADVYGLGQWLAARYGITQLRIRAVQVDPRATPGTAGWHAVLGAEVADVITVNWAPGSAPAINTRCIIIGISHDATPSRWLATFVLMVAPDPALVLDDSSAGVLSSGTLTL